MEFIAVKAALPMDGKTVSLLVFFPAVLDPEHEPEVPLTFQFDAGFLSLCNRAGSELDHEGGVVGLDRSAICITVVVQHIRHLLVLPCWRCSSRFVCLPLYESISFTAMQAKRKH